MASSLLSLLTRTSSRHEESSGAKQNQAEQLSSDATLLGATRVRNKARILELLGSHPERLLERGSVGETALHMCFLYAAEENVEFANWLLDLCPALITAIYEHPLYRGENVAHMAIANDFPLTVLNDLIIRSPSLVHGRADGDFFRPGTEGVRCAWGEFPLSFAVSLNRPAMVRFLVEKAGADLLARDTDGNTALHFAVLYARQEMVDLLVSLWTAVQARRALNEARRVEGLGPVPPPKDVIVPPADYPLSAVPLEFRLGHATNKDGHTPLVFAAKRGDAVMFNKMWETSRTTAWSYAHVVSYMYPLENVDDIWDLIEVERKKKEGAATSSSADSAAVGVRARTALQLLTDEDFGDDVLASSEITVLTELLDHKWAKYAGRIFLRRFMVVVVYLAIFAATVVMRGRWGSVKGPFDRTPGFLSALGAGHFAACSSRERPPSPEPWGGGGWEASGLAALTGVRDAVDASCSAGIAGEIIVVLGALLKLALSAQEFTRVGARYFFSQQGAARLERSITVVFCLCIFGTVAAEALGDEQAVRNLLALASIVGHSSILWFLLGWRLTGPFVVMLGRMLSADLARFLSIAIVMLVGFSQAFFVQLGLQGPHEFLRALRQGFSSMVGGEAPHDMEGGGADADSGGAGLGATVAAPSSTAPGGDAGGVSFDFSPLYIISMTCS
jgi:transient receptor potential cation channel subfamily V protein 5